MGGAGAIISGAWDGGKTMDSGLIGQLSPDWIWQADTDGQFLYTSERCRELLGYAAAELLTLSIADLAVPRSTGAFADLAHQQSPFRLVRNWVRHKDGHVLEVETNGEPILDAAGRIRGVLAITRDRTDPTELRRRSNAEDRWGEAVQVDTGPAGLAARQRDALVREVHHRIKNTLQGVANLLWQQSMKNPGSRDAIEQAIGQVRSIAAVYGLQGKFDSGIVLLCELVPLICSTAESLFQKNVDVVLCSRLTRKRLVMDEEAVPLALVVNELVCNAIKHSATGSQRTRVDVDLGDAEDSARLVVRNCGSLSPAFDFNRGAGLGTGLDLVRALLPRRGARLRFETTAATVDAILELSSPVVD
jgi:PAS domain S-box-containing protein